MALYSVLSAADFFLTLGLLQASQGEVFENNPVAGVWLANYGWTGLAVFKFAMVVLFVVLCVLISRYSPRASGRVLAFACAAVGVVVLCSSYCLLVEFWNCRSPAGYQAEIPLVERLPWAGPQN